ncbi:hypothetical protein [Pseudonocardia lacus]|uniref:hypothetical protein n=1 Tax=Pseudonocardia lacus TaxID=2835865 RepID=UPI001BDCF491|nr:hypothetical protein [Pseudonocardia lacus]
MARLLAVLVAGAALVGCTQAVGGEGASGTGAAVAPGAAEPVAELPVLGSRYAVDSADGPPVAVRVDLNEVRVVEQVLQVTFTARNTNAPARGDAPPQRWQVADFFSDGATAADALDAVDGVYVVDPVHTTRHLPGRNPDGQCLCSGGLSGVFVHPGDGAILTATFAAPTPDVEVVNVYVPQVGEFTGVRVQR